MGAIQDILSNVDVNQIASVLGQNPHDVQSAATIAAGALLNGVENNAAGEDGAISLANALGQHMASPASGDQIDLNTLDLADGASIVNHVLGAQQQQQLFGGSQGALVQKLMPILAPIVMAYLAKRLQSQGGLGSVLGQVLGGSQAQQSQGGFGDVLGQILGGSQSGMPNTTKPASVPAGGGLGDILGQILGGGAATEQVPQSQQYQQPAQATQGGMADPGLGQQYGSGAQTPSVGGLLKSILFGN